MRVGSQLLECMVHGAWSSSSAWSVLPAAAQTAVARIEWWCLWLHKIMRQQAAVLSYATFQKLHCSIGELLSETMCPRDHRPLTPLAPRDGLPLGSHPPASSEPSGSRPSASHLSDWCVVVRVRHLCIVIAVLLTCCPGCITSRSTRSTDHTFSSQEEFCGLENFIPQSVGCWRLLVHPGLTDRV